MFNGTMAALSPRVFGLFNHSESFTNAVFVVSNSSPYLHAYNFGVYGFGRKYKNPTTLISSTLSLSTVSINSSKNIVLVGGGSTPYLHAYAWSDDGFGNKYADPSTITGTSYAKFAASGNDIAILSATSPYIFAYAWSSGFGSRYANPSTGLPSGASSAPALEFNPASTVIGIAGGTSSPYVHAYAWTNGTGFGSKYANPSTLPSGRCENISWSPSGNDIAFSSDSSSTNYINVYKWSSGFGTKYSSPTLNTTNTIEDIRFHPSGNYIFILQRESSSSGTGISVYEWSASGFGTRLSDPSFPVFNRTSQLATNSTGSIVFGLRNTLPQGGSIEAYKFNNGFEYKYTSSKIVDTILYDMVIK